MLYNLRVLDDRDLFLKNKNIIAYKQGREK
jgi:hypothetical protein